MRIFISYRRGASADIVGRIDDHLRERFGPNAVFRDVDNIPIGVDFHKMLMDEVSKANVVLVVIGPDWLTRGDLSSDDDFVRIEIQAAIDRKVNLVPLLVQGTPMPTEEQLPEPLWPLLRQNALVVSSGADFKHHMNRLAEGVEALGPKDAAAPAGKRRLVFAAVGGALLLGMAAVGVIANRPEPEAASDVAAAGEEKTRGPEETVAARSERQPAETEPESAAPAVKPAASGPSDALLAAQSKAPLNPPAGMVGVPAGPYWMGCNERVDTECDDDEKEGRVLELSAFFIDRTEVTVGAYKECVEAGACKDSMFRERRSCNYGKDDRDDYPMNCVRWLGAKTYCEWAGKRLPTEHEWEKAARGPTGLKYPWGNADFGSAKVANIADATSRIPFGRPDYDDGFAKVAPVGQFPAGKSPYGALDMVGNVVEWTGDWYKKPVSRVIRGGSFMSAAKHARASARGGKPLVQSVYDDIGFRCAKSP